MTDQKDELIQQLQKQSHEDEQEMSSLRAQLKAAREEIRKIKKELQEKDKILSNVEAHIEDIHNDNLSNNFIDQIGHRMVE